MDWNLVKSFLAVAETGSLSAAARRLGISQPTIGRHVAELEAEIGVTLFRRGRSGYEPTESGLALYERGKVMSEQAAAFARLALGTADAIAGTVRITASEVVSAYVLPAILARLGREEPDIEIELVASNQVDNLLRRDADIAIRMVEPRQNELVARRIADLPLCACAAILYLDSRGRPAHWRELTGHDLIGLDRSDDVTRTAAALGVTLDRHAFRFRCDNQIVLWEAVKAGNGIGFAQRALVDREATVEAILPDMPLPVLPMWLAMHRDVRTSARIRRVADFLHAELGAYARGQDTKLT